MYLVICLSIIMISLYNYIVYRWARKLAIHIYRHHEFQAKMPTESIIFVVLSIITTIGIEWNYEIICRHDNVGIWEVVFLVVLVNILATAYGIRFIFYYKK